MLATFAVPKEDRSGSLRPAGEEGNAYVAAKPGVQIEDIRTAFEFDRSVGDEKVTDARRHGAAGGSAPALLPGKNQIAVFDVPAHVDAALRRGQGTVATGVAGELVQQQGQRTRPVRVQDNVGSFERISRGITQFLLEQPFEARPGCGPVEGSNPSFQHLGEIACHPSQPQ